MTIAQKPGATAQPRDAYAVPPAREPLLLIPGHLCDARMWRQVLPALASQADVRVLTPGARDSIAALADDILAVAPARFALCGFSLGGYIALELMRRVPARITRLALLDTSARPDTPARTAARRTGIDAVERGKFSLVVDAFVEMVSGPVLRQDPTLTAELRAMMRSPDPALYIAQQQAMIARPDARPGLAAIDCPTLVAWGEQDVTTPVDGHHEMAALIPGALATGIANAAHMAPMEQPEAVAALLTLWLQFPAKSRSNPPSSQR